MYNEMETYLETINWSKRLAKELPILEEIINSFPKEKTLRILDVGCGPGIHLNKLAEKYPRFTFFGVDVNESMIEHAQSTIPEASSNITFSTADFVHDPNIPENIDFIYSLGNSLSLMWGNTVPTETFSKLGTILNGDGQLFFQILNGDTPRQGYWTSKIIRTKADLDIFTTKRFEPNLTAHTQHVDFITFYKNKDEQKYSHKVNKSSWFLLPVSQLGHILKERGFQEIKFWEAYNKTPHNPDSSDSLLCLASR